MNKLIFRKLSFDIFSFFLLSSLAITSIVWVIQGVNLLDIVSEQGHGLKVYFFYTILNLPKIFSKLLVFTYFLTMFVVLARYEENNEMLVFWSNGIKKITFINFIGKLSFIFVILQLLLTVILVPYTQNLKQEYLKNSTIEFFPNLIKEKRFSNLSKNLTIFVEENKKDGFLEGIYIKEKISSNESKVIIASKGRLVKNNNNESFKFKLFDGNITNIKNKETINIGPDEEFVTINKIAEICSNITGVNLNPIYKKDRPKEVKHATCSADKARKLLNYKTKVSLDDGIKKTFDYIKLRGVRPFDYNINIEINNDLTPSTWKNKEI